jgi:hypothetical protein
LLAEFVQIVKPAGTLKVAPVAVSSFFRSFSRVACGVPTSSRVSRAAHAVRCISSRTLRGIFPLAVCQEIGMTKAELNEMKQFRRERAAGGDETAFRKYFRRDLHDGLVRNLRKVRLITSRIAPGHEGFGLKLAAG